MLQSERVFKDVSTIFKTNEAKEANEMGQFNSLTQSDRWQRLVRAARRALEEQGYTVVRMPGRGLSNIVKITKDGKTALAAIRTTQDRYIAFNPLEAGGWKTLDEVEWVVVAAVDKPEAVAKIIVHLFPAADVRQRFNASLEARLAAGYGKKDFAMWLALDLDDTSGSPSAVGSGIVGQYEPIGVYSADELTALPGAPAEAETAIAEAATPPEPAQEAKPTSIADVLRAAREQIARIAGVRVDAVSLELKIGA